MSRVIAALLTLIGAALLGLYLGSTLPWYAALPVAFLSAYGLGTLGAKVVRHFQKAGA